MNHPVWIFLLWTLACAGLAFGARVLLERIIRPKGSSTRTLLHLVLTLLVVFVIIVLGNALFLRFIRS